MSTKAKVSAAVAAILLLKKKKNKKTRKTWVFTFYQKRDELSIYKTLMIQLSAEDEELYTNFVRMTPDTFKWLLARIYPAIAKKDTVMRKAISAGERLALTLRYIASGDSYHSLQYLFRIPVSTISKIVPEVCKAISSALREEYVKMPCTEEEWRKVAENFDEKWNFPLCIGALDGKHVPIKAPANAGSVYYNYKGTHSIVLLALVDASYRFLYVNVGATGRNADGGVFNGSKLCQSLAENTLHLPPPQPLPGREKPVPFVIVADDAFALKANIMKPFSFHNQNALERIFNYRLSRARRVVENAFGLASARFRILRRTIELRPKNVKVIVNTICVLHNLLSSQCMSMYSPPGTFDCEVNGEIQPGTWRNIGNVPLLPAEATHARNYCENAKNVRNEYREYFGTRQGEVPWQYKHI